MRAEWVGRVFNKINPGLEIQKTRKNPGLEIPESFGKSPGLEIQKTMGKILA
jgi:hypothetical protein